MSYKLSLAMPSVLSKSATSVASRSVCDGSVCDADGGSALYIVAENVEGGRHTRSTPWAFQRDWFNHDTPKYVKAEAWDRRMAVIKARVQQRELLMAQFRAVIPDCYECNRFALAMNCCIYDQKMLPSVEQVAYWLWLIGFDRLVRLQHVVAKISMFIAVFLR